MSTTGNPHQYGATRFLALAHRGGAGLGPENTLATCERSLALGSPYLETDARTTADGVAVAFHDDRLDRATDAAGALRRQPWRRVRRARVDGVEPVATIEDMLGAFPQARVSIDVKDPGVVPGLVRAIERTGARGRVCIAGGRQSWHDEVSRRLGSVTSSFGWGPLAAFLASLRLGNPVRPKAKSGQFMHLPWSLHGVDVMAKPELRRQAVAANRAAGVRTLVWTVNDATAMNDLVDDGVDGIFTDRPDVLREVLVARGRWQPMPGRPCRIRPQGHATAQGHPTSAGHPTVQRLRAS